MDKLRFDSVASTSFVSAPSSPRSTCSDSFKYSYPCNRSTLASPTSSSTFASYGYSTIPFAWEGAVGTPRSPKPSNDVAVCSFSFQFNGFDRITTTGANQLFKKGRIHPIKPKPSLPSPKSRRSLKSLNRMLWYIKERDDFDPFMASLVISSRSRKGSLSLRRREVKRIAFL